MSKPAGRQGIAENSQPIPPQIPAKIFGSYIWPEMRMICNLFDLSGRNYKVEQVGEIFTESGLKEETAFNPARTMPLVLINETKILADPATLAKHICRHYNMEQLYPLAANMDRERQKIDQILEVVFLHFKRASDRLCKLSIQERSIASRKISLTVQQLADKDNAFAYENNVVKEVIMRTVEQWLNETESSYLVTDKVSVADLAVFHELMQAITFAQLTIDAQEFPRLSEWYKWIEQTWASGQLKGKTQFVELCDRLSASTEN